MAASKTTSEGILAIWRPGSETAKGPITKGLGRKLYFAGRVSLPLLLEVTYLSQGFEYPGDSPIEDSDFEGAEQLNAAAAKIGIGVVCVRYSNARLDEVSTMRRTLRQGCSSIEENTRKLAGIENPFTSAKSEATRLAYVGGLYIPQPNIKLPDAMVHLGLTQTAK